MRRTCTNCKAQSVSLFIIYVAMWILIRSQKKKKKGSLFDPNLFYSITKTVKKIHFMPFIFINSPLPGKCIRDRGCLNQVEQTQNQNASCLAQNVGNFWKSRFVDRVTNSLRIHSKRAHTDEVCCFVLVSACVYITPYSFIRMWNHDPSLMSLWSSSEKRAWITDAVNIQTWDERCKLWPRLAQRSWWTLYLPLWVSTVIQSRFVKFLTESALLHVIITHSSATQPAEQGEQERLLHTTLRQKLEQRTLGTRASGTHFIFYQLSNRHTLYRLI